MCKNGNTIDVVVKCVKIKFVNDFILDSYKTRTIKQFESSILNIINNDIMYYSHKISLTFGRMRGQTSNFNDGERMSITVELSSLGITMILVFYIVVNNIM